VDPSAPTKIAHNDAVFREANERIAAGVARLDVGDPLPFLCECADPSCTTIVRVGRAEYEEVRSQPRWFVTAPGHEETAAEFGRPVRRGDGYVVIEKTGRAGEVAEELEGATDLLDEPETAHG
jgi:hypothetical protein